MGANSRPKRDDWANDEHYGFLQLWVDASFPSNIGSGHQMEPQYSVLLGRSTSSDVSVMDGFPASA